MRGTRVGTHALLLAGMLLAWLVAAGLLLMGLVRTGVLFAGLLTGLPVWLLSGVWLAGGSGVSRAARILLGTG